MSILNFFSAKRKLRALKNSAPQMIYGYEQNGLLLKDTRVGSATSIVGKEGLTLEDNVFIGQFNFIEATNGIHIGEGCQITNYVSIITHSSHLAIRLYGDQYRKTADPVAYNKGSVKIGKYTFVGPHVTIMPDTEIGMGSIVASHSMVKGNFPDFSVIGGTPAKVIGDTRKLDEPYLNEHPELRTNYDNWAKK
ncbi:MAG: acyltransferase [Crocinitomicaceae bacterium]|nr:acyltransferase [Flavobacteriales bacterium]NQZ34535.1 acyltransferase [Crocinitomicaceae bacterium]